MKGIIIASFGSSHREAYEKSIGRIRNMVKKEYSETYVNEAISSDMVRKIVDSRDGHHYFNMGEALLDMENRGIREIYVLSLYAIKGVELEKIIEQAKEYNDDLRLNIKFTEALLGNSKLIIDTAEALRKYKTDDYDGVVLMGHGSYHEADTVYEKLQAELDSIDSKVYIGTVEGSLDLDSVMSRLAWSRERRILLAPMMLVAGEHARNDMVGEEDSWRMKLEELGCEISVLMEGLCENDEINDIFMTQLRGIQ